MTREESQLAGWPSGWLVVCWLVGSEVVRLPVCCLQAGIEEIWNFKVGVGGVKSFKNSLAEGYRSIFSMKLLLS
jgi:hypothetical protein